MGVGVGVAGTHITRYLLENVLEVLLLFSFLVGVARPWLWKHKAKLAHRGGGGQTRRKVFWPEGARVPTTARGAAGAASGQCCFLVKPREQE